MELLNLQIKKLNEMEKRLEFYFKRLKFENEISSILNGTYVLESEIQAVLNGIY